MLRASKLGFEVRRIKDKLRKKRLLGLTNSGDVVLHKLGIGKFNPASVRLQRPYWKLSLRSMADCFECSEAAEPSLILDFKDKMLHLAVDSLLDRDYMVKGFRLLMQRQQQNSSFFTGHAPSSSKNRPTSGAATAQAMMGSSSAPKQASGEYVDHDDDEASVASVFVPSTNAAARR
jgi:hypothetical protein